MSMIATSSSLPTTTRVRPRRITAAFWLWMLALTAGVFEAAISVTQALSAGEQFGSLLAPIGIRLLAFVVLAVLALALRAGRGWSRYALLVLFTGLGTWSLVADPLTYLLDGGTVSDALAAATGWDAAFLVSRVVHILAVWTASVLMFTAPSYFRRNAVA